MLDVNSQFVNVEGRPVHYLLAGTAAFNAELLKFLAEFTHGASDDWP
jgi:hypothetical protein